MKVQSFPFPIGVQLFNRPEYAEKVLTSLRDQNFSVDQSKVFVYIDGFKGSIHDAEGRVDNTREVEDLARSIFPRAIVARFDHNLGIADLHNHLQEKAYSNGQEWAVFIEEDLILEKGLLRELSDLIGIVDGSEEVVRVACSQILPSLSHLPRGHDGFYPGRGTQAFAERRSFFTSKQKMVCNFIDLIKPKLGSRDQFKDNQAAAVMATYGHVLPYLQHDSLIESIVFQQKKLHVVTRPTLVTDIGVNGIHNYTTPLVSNVKPHNMNKPLFESRLRSFHNELPSIRTELNDYMLSILRELFDSYHLTRSRIAMLKRILER